MASTIRNSPLEPPRAGRFGRQYTALVRADGTILPIEERLGRRLLRTIESDSPEAGSLLRAGRVRLVRDNGRVLGEVPIGEVYDLLEAEVGEKLDAPNTESEARRRLRAARGSIERWRRMLAREH